MDNDKKDKFDLLEFFPEADLSDYNDRERAELELVERTAWLVAGLKDGVVPNSEFMDRAASIVDEYRKSLRLGSLDIDTTISFIRKILVRAMKIRRVKIISRKKKKSLDEGGV